MENVEWIISLASACLGLIITIATLIAKFAKSTKAKKAAQQTVEICNALVPYIEEAEKLTHYTGEEKKAYVMTRIRQYAVNADMKLDENKVSDTVEELVTMSKQVNARKTDKSTITIPTSR